MTPWCRLAGHAMVGLAALCWLIGGAVFWVGLWLGSRGTTIAGDRMHWSNCVTEAWDEYLRRLRAGYEPYLWGRASRAQNGLIHVGVGDYDDATDQLSLWSWKPLVYRDVPWWLAWTRLRFRGAWRTGDRDAER